MPKATVARPFVWRDGHTNVLIEKGEQELTDDQFEHAKNHGFLLTIKQAQQAKKELKPEVLDHGND